MKIKLLEHFVPELLDSDRVDLLCVFDAVLVLGKFKFEMVD